MAITNAQQYKQMQLVKPRADGKRPGYYGADAGFGDDDYKDAASDFQDSFNEKTSGGGNYISDSDAKRVLDARPDLQQGIDNAAKYKADADKRRKEKEKADKERRAKERKEARKDQKKLTAKEKKTRRMQKAAFDRFQQLEKYVDPFGDETTFAGMSGEDAANLTGFKGNIESGFEYDKDFFRDSKTGKFKKGTTEIVDGVEQLKSDFIPGYDFSINPVKSNFQSGLGTLTSTGSTTKVRPNDYGIQIPTGTSLDIISGIVRPETGLQAFNTLEEARNIGDLTSRYAGGDDSAYDEYLDLIDRTNPTTGGGGGGGQQQDPCLGPNPPAYCNVNNTPADPATPKRNLGGLAPRFAGSIFDFTGLADGGRAGKMDGGMMEDTPEGGIMDLESGRQMYFLGKLVKKATRAVKKVVKSPFGKAALGAALTFGIPGTSFGGLMGKAGGLSGLKAKLFGEFGGTSRMTEGILGKLGLTGGGGAMMPTLKGGLTLGLGLPFALDALGIGKDKDDDKMDLDEYYRKNSINIADIRNNPYNFLAPRFAADGGLMRTGYEEGGDAEPVAKKTMPLLDMDGMEKDYREDGGFVPIGRMERADDVPARLSKNEFVFTADAVRNAGEGDIDKGAEVMYNMMKNLESGGEVSEESQGLDGAREMFKTSQRLEEVL